MQLGAVRSRSGVVRSKQSCRLEACEKTLEAANSAYSLIPAFNKLSIPTRLLYKFQSLSSDPSVLPLPASPTSEEDTVSKATSGGTLEKFDPLDTHVPDFSCTGRYTHRFKDNSNYVGLDEKFHTHLTWLKGKLQYQRQHLAKNADMRSNS